MINKVIGNYKILKEIGEGGMGTVYLAEHITLGTKTALKILFPHLAHDQSMSERFIREAKAQASLKHPNIIRAIDYLEYDECKALVMEYIDGKSLSRVLEEKKDIFSYEEILHIIEGPLQALNYAHSRGIIHRDVKPSNIIIDDNNKGYLTDFGIAMILGMDRKTKTGANLGTPHYMSPEQALEPKKVDHRTDIYSIGCVLYEMATGIPPFDGDTDFQIITKHKEEIPKSITMINPDIPSYFATAIFKAMEKDPNNRFSGCSDLLEALRNNKTSFLYETYHPTDNNLNNAKSKKDDEKQTAEVTEKNDYNVKTENFQYKNTSKIKTTKENKVNRFKSKPVIIERREIDWELVGKIVLWLLAIAAGIAVGYGIYLIVAAIIQFISDNWLIIIIVIIILLFLFGR